MSEGVRGTGRDSWGSEALGKRCLPVEKPIGSLTIDVSDKSR